MSEGVVNLGDTTVQSQGGDFEKKPVRRIKMTQGQMLRLTFLSDEVVSRLRHYAKGVGYRRCLSYQGFCPGCLAADKNSEFWKGKDFKRATEAFGANVFVYDTDQSMQQLSNQIGSIHLFVFGTEKFSQLRTIKQMYGSLVGLDLMVTCIDEGFQKMTITPYPKENSFCNIPQIQEFIQKSFKEDAYPLDKMIAKEVTPAQMVKDFSLNPAIMNLPEAKSFQQVAEQAGAQQATAQPAQEQKQFFNPAAAMTKPASAPAQTVQAPKQEPAKSAASDQPPVRTVDTSTLLDEL